MSGTKAPRWSGKGRVVLLTIFSAAVVFASTTQTWLTVVLPEQAVPTPNLDIAGSDAATAVTALALVALAGAMAATIASRVGRFLIALIIFAAAAGIIASALSVATHPKDSAESQVADAIGIIGSSATTTVTVFPAVAIGGGVLLAASAVILVLAGRYWGRSKRFDTTAAPATGGPEGRGPAQQDPVRRGAAQQDPVRRGAPGQSAAQAGNEPADEIDSWDQLSRGKDPTG